MNHDPFDLHVNDRQKKSRRFRLWTIIIAILFVTGLSLLALILSLPDIEKLDSANPKTTALIELRKLEAKESGHKLIIHQHWVRYKVIPKLLKDAIRISEDASFFQHEGIDYDELIEAVKRNLDKKKFARGASTITQQLAKNLYLSTEKSLLRKFKEYIITRQLEEHLTKTRIFHLYLNVIEFGRGIYGVEAASRFYFGKHVSELSLAEIIRITAIIPKPLIENPTKNSRYVLWHAKWILHKLQRYKYIDDDTYDETLSEFTQ